MYWKIPIMLIQRWIKISLAVQHSAKSTANKIMRRQVWTLACPIVLLASLQNHFGVKSFECCTMCLMCHGSCRFWNLIEQSRSKRSKICCNSNWRAAVHHETHKTSWCKAWLTDGRCNAARDNSHVFATLQLIHGKPYQEIQFRSTWSSANWVDNRWCSFCH